MQFKSIILILGATWALVACGGSSNHRPVDNVAGRPTTYVDPGSRGIVSGVGVESQDILSMTEQMMRSIISSGILNNRSRPPRIIMDAAYFENQSSQPINKNLIVDRLRTGLIRASQGRMMFVARQNIAMVEKERQLKRDGQVDQGTAGMTQATAGGDYRLTGSIKSLDARDRNTGAIQRYSQITFELIDLEYGTIVWADDFEFSKFAQDDAIYR
ncbi:penicillin-binding protein activator LpoB [Marinicella meishanensis]|uniref:penicillin-binding protein activator LpoB n=1 Tax=Marinicella meishanensis TaxID=2873263 RepID=UPI001CBD90A3